MTEGSAEVTAARKIRRRIPGLSEAGDAARNPDVSLVEAVVEEGVRDAVVKLGARARGLMDDLQLGGDCRDLRDSKADNVPIGVVAQYSVPAAAA